MKSAKYLRNKNAGLCFVFYVAGFTLIAIWKIVLELFLSPAKQYKVYAS